MKSLKKKDPDAPLITCDIGGMKFSSLCYIQVQVWTSYPKALYDNFQIRELEPFFLELQLANGPIK